MLTLNIALYNCYKCFSCKLVVYESPILSQTTWLKPRLTAVVEGVNLIWVAEVLKNTFWRTL